MRICGGCDKTKLVCDSEIVNFDISNRDGFKYKTTARSINELNLPEQATVNIAKYRHITEIQDKISTYSSCKSEILLGQHNYHLITPTQVIKGQPSEPYATLTPLGWCIHGRVPNLLHDNVSHSSLFIHDDQIL